MKNIYLTLFLVFGFLSLNAQKVDLDRQYFNHKYRRLPNVVLDPSVKSYSVDINKTTALAMYSNETASDKVNIEGRKKVDSGGQLQIKVDLKDLIIEGTEVKERVEVQKDKEGKETGRKYYYHVQVTYSFDAEASASDNTGKILAKYSLASRNAKNTWNSGEYSSSSQASNYYNNNKLEIKTQLITKHIDGSLHELKNNLNLSFGYKSMDLREHIWSLDSKKHPEYVAYNEACNKLKAILETMTADNMPADIATQLQPVADYFNSLPEKYSNDPKDKGQVKIRYGAYFNLAALYFYSEQYDKAKEYANKIIANEYDHKDGRKLIEEVDDILATFSKHGINTRHFVPNVEGTALGQ